MNRRSFLYHLGLGAVTTISILPGATTYTRNWKTNDTGLIVPVERSLEILQMRYSKETESVEYCLYHTITGERRVPRGAEFEFYREPIENWVRNVLAQNDLIHFGTTGHHRYLYRKPHTNENTDPIELAIIGNAGT